MNDRYSKLAFLHRVKERKTPSLSAQASLAPSSLKVAWSGKSLNKYICLSPHCCQPFNCHLGCFKVLFLKSYYQSIFKKYLENCILKFEKKRQVHDVTNI